MTSNGGRLAVPVGVVDERVDSRNVLRAVACVEDLAEGGLYRRTRCLFRDGLSARRTRPVRVATPKVRVGAERDRANDLVGAGDGSATICLAPVARDGADKSLVLTREGREEMNALSVLLGRMLNQRR